MNRLIILIIISTLFSCKQNTSSSQNKESVADCLVNYDWCYPNCNKPNSAWKFFSDGTFNFSTTLFGGNSAWGNWKDLGEKNIQLTYTKTTTGYGKDQVVTMPDCKTLKVGQSLYKR